MKRAATAMTTAPITVSMTLPLIARLPAALFRRPRLVIAGRASAVAAAQHRAGRMVGQGGPGHVRQVVLFPGMALARLGQLVDHVMQPGMPFRRHLGALRLAIIDDPAPVAAEPPAAAPGRLLAPEAVIAIPIGIGPDGFAAQPGQYSGSECCAHFLVLAQPLSHLSRPAVKPGALNPQVARHAQILRTYSRRARFAWRILWPGMSWTLYLAASARPMGYRGE